MFKPTTEQQAIIDAVKACSAVKVYALAGTGKTTTLRLIAEAYPKARMLYLAFNKAIADEARNKFPDNVDVRTVHSLAFGYVGKHYWGRLSNLDYHAIADVLRLDLSFVFANIKFYERYCHSAVPFTEEDIEAFMEGQGVGVLNDRERVKIVRFIYKTTEPVLYQIRKRVPFDLGGLDISPVIAILVIIFLQTFVVGSLHRLAYSLS
jgi:hypothetical protein